MSGKDFSEVMRCRTDKDLSRLCCSGRLRVLERKHFFKIYVWDSYDALVANTRDSDENTGALCSHMPTRERLVESFWPDLLRRVTLGLVDRRGWKLDPFPKLGELHFVTGKWDEEVVAHECLHATLNIGRQIGVSVLDRNGWQDINGEERLCYVHGEMVKAVYRWLWKEDKGMGIVPEEV